MLTFAGVDLESVAVARRAFISIKRLRGIQAWWYDGDDRFTVLLNNGTLQPLHNMREVVIFLRCASSVINR